MSNHVVIVGHGGNSCDVAHIVEWSMMKGVLGYLDDERFDGGWLGRLEDAKVLCDKWPFIYFVNTIGSPLNFRHKKEIIDRLGLEGSWFINVIHPSVDFTLGTIGTDVVMLQNVVLGSGSIIGSHVMILPNSIISHDSRIGDYSTIAGGVCVSGGAEVGEHCYLGTNCCLRGGVKIGVGSMIGMGAVVLDDVPAGSTMVGNPARDINTLGTYLRGYLSYGASR